MLDYRLDAETEALRKTVREFAVEVVPPQIGEFYERDEFPTAIVRQMGELGLFGLPFPEEYGGSGGDYFHLCVALEELARVDSSVAITLEAGVSLGAMPIYRFGTEEQKREWLPRLCSGEALGAFGLTEPGGGSDAGATKTSARVEDGHWGIEGFTVGQRYSKVGWNASDTRELSFSDCRVPAENLVGEQGRGYAQFLSILDEGRIAISALSGGLAQGCVDESVKYAAQREAFGQPIGRNQAIQFMIADMEVRASTARLSYYRAAEKMLRGEPFKREASIAKLYSSEVAMDNARYATQVHGGYGFMNEFPVGRFYRDAKILEIGEGTSEVQRMLIARDLGVG